MRVLLITTPVTTHLTPILPTAWALKSAGHQVLAAGHPDVVAAAERAGLPTWPVGAPFYIREQMAGHLVRGRRPIELGVYRGTDGNWDALNKVWVDDARATVRAYLDLARGWRPDLLLTDPLEYAGRMVGGLLGVPVVQHRWGIDVFSGQADGLARRSLPMTMADLGLGALPDPALILDPCPPSLQVEDAPPARSVRHVHANGSGPVPAWVLEPPERRRVCLSFGRLTASLNGLPLFRRVIDAVAAIPDVEAVLTLEPEFQERLGPVPSCVRVVAPVPLELFLGSCEAVVHHGGSTTCLTAASLGVPQLVLPGWGDGFALGERLAAVGAGRSIGRVVGQNNARAIGEAVTALLDDPAYRTAARRLADEVAGLPTPAQLVPELEKLTDSPGG
ncbi:nucleotide disphospho-sugar-binding domain-containing protein [Actinomadura fibrosa]|uniref:Nucleotide disphospho-sugar-binding domain-containing protein n=1 Tax=Actinomadura fibrosa TaxID=111802 RepID=A0ABW2XUJ5_9ACTN|nr:nucleotide disphospho-sugar-binding domain-containing protein [Actinomadura fibrosa]